MLTSPHSRPCFSSSWRITWGEGGWAGAGQAYYNIAIRKVLSSHKTQPWQENNACWVRRGEVELVAKLSEEQGTNNWTQDDWRTQCSPSVNFLNNPWFLGLTIKSICGQENEKTGNPILLSPFLRLAMKLSLYSAPGLACLSASAWRERKRGKHDVLFLFKVPLFLLGFGAYREPSCGARGPCWSPLICLLPWSAASTRGWWALPWLSFPALVKIHREVGNGFMIKAELDLYQRRFPSWKSEPLENSLDPRGRLLDCPHRPAWKEKGAGPQIGPAFNVNPPEESVWPQAAVCMLCFHGPVSMACLVTGKTGMGRAGKRIGNLTELNISNEEATSTGMTHSGVPCKTGRILSPGWTPFQQ